MDLAKEEKCEFLPFLAPKKLILKEGRISGMEFNRTEVKESGELIIDEEQLVRLRADYIISAFGSGLFDENLIKALEPLKFAKSTQLQIDPKTMASSEPWVYCGGDVAGISETTVESVNDGKTASWNMHKYLQVA